MVMKTSVEQLIKRIEALEQSTHLLSTHITGNIATFSLAEMDKLVREVANEIVSKYVPLDEERQIELIIVENILKDRLSIVFAAVQTMQDLLITESKQIIGDHNAIARDLNAAKDIIRNLQEKIRINENSNPRK